MRQVKIILNVDEGSSVPSIDSVVVVDNGKGWRGEPAQAAEVIAKIDEPMHLVAIEIANMLASFERIKRQTERLEAKTQKLTPEQIKSWRVVLLGVLGTYALFMSDEMVQAAKDVMVKKIPSE